jgi:hypothetical protein
MRVQDVVDFLKLPSVQTVHIWNTKGVGPPYYWAGHQIRYQRREVLKWFVEHTGPYARCDSECGRAFPLRDFKKVTDQQRGPFDVVRRVIVGLLNTGDLMTKARQRHAVENSGCAVSRSVGSRVTWPRRAP